MIAFVDGNAIFGFAGVIVGAAATYVGQRGVERRAERGEVKVAVRVQRIFSLRWPDGRKIWWTAVEEKVAFPNWDRYEVVLARSLRFGQMVSCTECDRLGQRHARGVQVEQRDHGDHGYGGRRHRKCPGLDRGT